LPAAVMLGGLLYLVSVVGQRLGAQQMDQLRAVFDELIEP
jgi:hypothetical protein